LALFFNCHQVICKSEYTTNEFSKPYKGDGVMQRKIIYYYIISTVLLVCVSFFSIELTTRIVSYFSGKGFSLSLHELDPSNNMTIYQWHPFTGFIFKPNAVFSGGHPYQKEKSSILVDKNGFLAKDQQLSYTKPANEIRIATIGGSTTANINLSFDDNWPGYLGQLVQKVFPEKNIRIINAGVPGFDTSQSIPNLALRVIPFHPDIIIIYHAYNDLKAIKYGIEFKPDYSHIHSTPYGYHEEPTLIVKGLSQSMFYVRTRNQYRKFKERIDANGMMLKALTDKDRLDYIPEEALQTFEQHIQSLVAIGEISNAKVILSSFATLYDPNLDYTKRETFTQMSTLQKKDLYSLMNFTPGLTVNAFFKGIKEYNTILKNIAIHEKTGWIDNASSVPHKDEYFVDRVHFSKKGAKCMAENILPVVLELIEKEKN